MSVFLPRQHDVIEPPGQPGEFTTAPNLGGASDLTTELPAYSDDVYGESGEQWKDPIVAWGDPAQEPSAAEAPAEENDVPEEDFALPEPHRPSRVTKALIWALLIAVGFTAGIWTNQRFGSSGAGMAVAGARPGGAGVSGGMPGTGQAGGATGTSPTGMPTAGTTPQPGAGQTAGSQTGTAAGSDTPVLIGTVVGVKGDQLTVRDFGGTEHPVTLGEGTTISKITEFELSDLTAGESLSISGTKDADGNVIATAVTAR
ncbi:MAG: hypothetical protein ACOYEV_02350 [Candidatus Nanopelagicales bacterium]